MVLLFVLAAAVAAAVDQERKTLKPKVVAHLAAVEVEVQAPPLVLVENLIHTVMNIPQLVRMVRMVVPLMAAMEVMELSKVEKLSAVVAAEVVASR